MGLPYALLRAAGAAALAALVLCGPAPAQEFVPDVGQEGKDVVWVPTAQTLVDKMLDMAKVGPGDYVIDLGLGDGRTVITAARRGAKALGIEFNPRMVELARRSAEQAGVADKARFVEATSSRATSPRRPCSRCSCCRS
jgi:methylase of polypeptide subunit release factors